MFYIILIIYLKNMCYNEIDKFIKKISFTILKIKSGSEMAAATLTKMSVKSRSKILYSIFFRRIFMYNTLEIVKRDENDKIFL